MGKNPLGIIGGTLLPKTRLIRDAKKIHEKTPYGAAELYDCGSFVFIQRHGAGDIPPHMINHRANVYALRERAEAVIGLASVGSLKKSLKPHTIVAPEDYMEFNPPTYYDAEIRHATPGFDEKLRRHILDVASWNKIKVAEGGVYIQTRGPRLETKAEVRMLASFGDMVGMTISSEATLACELGLPYAAICSVDNYANGISKSPLEFRDIKDSAHRNSETIETLLERILEAAR